MAKKKYSAGDIAMGAATVAAGAGAGVALSSETMANILSMSETYAGWYGNGQGFAPVALRFAPGALVATAVGLIGDGPASALAAATIGGGSIIGALSGPVKRNVGDKIAGKLFEWANDAPASGGQGGAISNIRTPKATASAARAMAGMLPAQGGLTNVPVNDDNNEYFGVGGSNTNLLLNYS